jgi:hypothetical protein
MTAAEVIDYVLSLVLSGPILDAGMDSMWGKVKGNGRGERIRTSGLLDPNQAL